MTERFLKVFFDVTSFVVLNINDNPKLKGKSEKELFDLVEGLATEFLHTQHSGFSDLYDEELNNFIADKLL